VILKKLSLEENKIIEMNNFHLIIFCKEEYKSLFLNHCVNSIEKFVRDSIDSKTIVSDVVFHYPNFDVISDNYFWRKFDNKFRFEKLYNDTWTRQQILKLNVDKLQKGNVLVVDADLIFLKSIRFVEGNKFNFYTAIENNPNYFNLISILLDVDKQIHQSFITDFGIFQTKILREIKNKIEKKHNQSFLEILHYLLPDSLEARLSNNGLLLSEYELYGNYFVNHYEQKINRIINPINYQDWIYLEQNFCKNSKSSDMIAYLQSITENYYQSIRINQ
jgi:hypothetical protein